MPKTTLGPWETLAQLRKHTAAVKRAYPERGDFFGRAESRFFHATYGRLFGGRYFTHATQFHPSQGEPDPRRWHVTRAGDRVVTIGQPQPVDFDTFGRWGTDGYDKATAERLAKQLADAEARGLIWPRSDRHERFEPCGYCITGWALFEHIDGAQACAACSPALVERRDLIADP